MLPWSKQLCMRIVMALLFAAISTNLYAQKEIKPEEVKNHIGDSIIVQGKISGVRFFETSSKTLINIGAAYPDQLFTIVILPEVRSKLHVFPTSKDVGNIVWVTGKVELYNGKPQIAINDVKQIDIIQNIQKEVDLE